MMKDKHAFLIGAYCWPEYLIQLIDSLDSNRSNFYIHINSANKEEFSVFIASVKNRANVYVSTEVTVKWGGATFFSSIRVLYQEALKNPENCYFHLITGSDVLIKPLNDLFAFFDNTNCSYIRWFKDSEKYRSRYYHYHFFDMINYRGNKFSKLFQIGMSYIQKILPIQRKRMPFNKLYVGFPWFSLNRNDMQYVNDYIEGHNLIKRIRMTCAPDEMLIQSILNNDATRSKNIVNNNLRMIVWGNYPGGQKTFTEEDFDSLISSDAFFARKIHPEKSKKLLELLNTHNSINM